MTNRPNERGVSSAVNVSEEIAKVVTNRHKYAQDWKSRTGRQVVGYLCTYVPEEIIYAAGMLPVKIHGSHDLQGASEQPYIYGMFCPYCRDSLATALKGSYDYLDGLVHANGCMHIRQTFQSWVQHAPRSFNHFLYIPDAFQNSATYGQIVEEMRDFRRAIEEWSGKAIPDGNLKEAIHIYNKNRQLLGQIYELRKADRPPILGSKAMQVVLSSLFMDKVDNNALLERVIEELTSKESKLSEPRARLLWITPENDDEELQRLVEELGGLVVSDDSCIGTRYFTGEVSMDGDPIPAIARRYMDKPLCPWKDMGTERRRVAHIQKLISDYNVGGVVFAPLKFCDGHQTDYPGIKAALEKMGIPSLVLECDLKNPVGQFRTRLEAFIDMIEE